MSPERLAGWIVLIGLTGCVAAAVNEECTLTTYYAVDQETGGLLKYEAIKVDVGAGYVIMESTYDDIHPQPTDEPAQLAGYYFKNFEQLRKWLKENKKEHPELHKKTRRIGFVK